MRKVLGFMLFFCTGSAFAQGYIGANYASVTYKEDGFSAVKPSAIAVRAGYQLNPNVAVEGRLGIGMGDDSLTVSGVTVDVEVDNFIGVYGRVMLPTGTAFTPYGLIGYTSGEITGSTGGISVSGDDSDFSFGFGTDIAIDNNLGINAEIAQLFKGDDFKVNALSVGLYLKF